MQSVCFRERSRAGRSVSRRNADRSPILYGKFVDSRIAGTPCRWQPWAFCAPPPFAFTQSGEAFGACNAYGDPDWTSVPATGSGGRSEGWVEISADLPVFGANRVIPREGTTANTPIVLYDATPFVPARN
ncbi:hypothetical protein WMF18_23065 [Sorangium sp. So ce315]|uniref:hypothetical protein n=1 Tax=Sorangium sp. So ce315 TaxID=3133299 RepID=UPI003F62CF7D